jgi:hypothetical protein
MPYKTYPLSSGITLPTALAAPVEAGMMFWAAVLPSLQALALGPSTVFWVAVYACTVVIRPSSMPNLSLITLASGARQLVVQEALLETSKQNDYFNPLDIKVIIKLHFKPAILAVERTLPDDVHGLVVFLVVHTHDEHGGISRWGRDDNLLCSSLHVKVSLLHGSEHTSRLHDVVSARLAPWDLFGLHAEKMLHC